MKRRYIWLLLALVLLVGIIELYLKLVTHQFSWPFGVVVIEVGVISLAVYKIPFLRDVIGEGRAHKYSQLRLILSMVLLTPFTLYMLVGGESKSIPELAQFSIIAIAPTLGGLVLAAAGNRRISGDSHSDLINVAQKLISATILFIFFVPLFFLVDLSGGININSLDFHLMGFVRGISFWIAAPCLYGGLILFLCGIIDLAVALGQFGASDGKSLRQEESTRELEESRENTEARGPVESTKTDGM